MLPIKCLLSVHALYCHCANDTVPSYHWHTQPGHHSTLLWSKPMLFNKRLDTSAQ